MSKCITTVKKSLAPLENAVVVGTGFGYLEEIVDVFKSVFVIADEPPNFRRKNLIYRQNFENMNSIIEISHIFIDRSQVSSLDKMSNIWIRLKPWILIEGDDVIERHEATSLWETEYIPVDRCHWYHVWKRK